MIENLVYPLPGEDLTGKRREDAIIEAARALNELDIDLLKLEYPGSPEGCRRLAAVLDRPWAVLSAGVPFDQFTEVLRVAFDDGGASGFIAGRSVWRESLRAVRAQSGQAFLDTVARPRLDTLRAVAAEPGTAVDRGRGPRVSPAVRHARLRAGESGRSSMHGETASDEQSVDSSDQHALPLASTASDRLRR